MVYKTYLSFVHESWFGLKFRNEALLMINEPITMAKLSKGGLYIVTETRNLMRYGL